MDYLEKAKSFGLESPSYELLEKQILSFQKLSSSFVSHSYQVGDDVFLKKGTFMHGIYKNMEGLEEIARKGLLSSALVEGRQSKYPFCVGVWNLKEDMFLKDYIDFYSGGTIAFVEGNKRRTKVIPFSSLDSFSSILKEENVFRWEMEQTKEARFLPSLVQSIVQVGIIFGCNSEVSKFLDGDILNVNVADDVVRPFVNPAYYERFVEERKDKDDFFTDRESAILFGLPSSLIEGVFVGREFEKDEEVLSSIKRLFPKCYICNLDGKVIMV